MSSKRSRSLGALKRGKRSKASLHAQRHLVKASAVTTVSGGASPAVVLASSSSVGSGVGEVKESRTRVCHLFCARHLLDAVPRCRWELEHEWLALVVHCLLLLLLLCHHVRTLLLADVRAGVVACRRRRGRWETANGRQGRARAVDAAVGAVAGSAAAHDEAAVTVRVKPVVAHEGRDGRRAGRIAGAVRGGVTDHLLHRVDACRARDGVDAVTIVGCVVRAEESGHGRSASDADGRAVRSVKLRAVHLTADRALSSVADVLELLSADIRRAAGRRHGAVVVSIAGAVCVKRHGRALDGRRCRRNDGGVHALVVRSRVGEQARVERWERDTVRRRRGAVCESEWVCGGGHTSVGGGSGAHDADNVLVPALVRSTLDTALSFLADRVFARVSQAVLDAARARATLVALLAGFLAVCAGVSDLLALGLAVLAELADVLHGLHDVAVADHGLKQRRRDQ